MAVPLTAVVAAPPFLGIHRDRMLLTLRSSGGSSSPALSRARAVLSAFGVDVRLWAGRPSLEATLQASLLAALRVPVNDWIVVAKGHEFVDFGGATVREYLEARELEVRDWKGWRRRPRVLPISFFLGSFNLTWFFLCV